MEVDGMRVRGWIIKTLSQLPKGNTVEVTEHLFYTAFPEPKGTFSDIALRNMLMVMNGNRPEETSEEILNIFLETNDIEFHKQYNSDTGYRYFFRKKISFNKITRFNIPINHIFWDD